MNENPVPFTVYGSTECDDTQRVQARLAEWGLAYRAVNIDHDPAAEGFVIFVNGGFRSTPTLVFDAGKSKTVFTEPTDAELAALLRQMGHDSPFRTSLYGAASTSNTIPSPRPNTSGK